MNRLFLVRHGQADVRHEYRPFYSAARGSFTRYVETKDKGLTELGRQTVKNDTVKGLRLHDVRPREHQIIHTDVPRARETALLLAEGLGSISIVESEMLARFSLEHSDLLDNSPATVIQHILSWEDIDTDEVADLVLVTHQPFIKSVIGLEFDQIPEGSIHRVDDTIISQI